MTIRYRCEGCDSILKVRDELAGTQGKCPKCKTGFTIPTVKRPLKVAQLAAAKTKKPTQTATALSAEKASPPFVDVEDPIDMPREVTPLPDLTSTKEFDPMQALTGSGPAIPAVPSEPEAARPSIAELMREHEASRKKKKGGDKKKGSLAEAAAAAQGLTSGSATDALTRTYDQKRGKAGEPPPMTREERREAEQRAALLDFAKKGGAGIAALLVGLYFLISWMLAEPLPDLEYVSGVVTINGAPLPDVEVQFAPIADPNNPEQETSKAYSGQRNPSSGYTNSAGEYVLMYDMKNEGAIVGNHQVSIMTSAGVSYNLPPQDQTKTVSADGDNVFNFSL
ncbi:MAG: hypothetical protein RIK87_14855 [Fuerstiella sp.]